MQLAIGPHHHVPFHDFVPLLLTLAFWMAVLALTLLALR